MRISVPPPGRPKARLRSGLGKALHRPGLARARPYITCCAGGFLLGAAGCGVTPLPLAAGLLASLDLSLLSLLTCLCASCGTLIFWGWTLGSEPAALLLLIFLSQALLEGTSTRHRAWLMPFLCAALTAVLGILFLLNGAALSSEGLPSYLLRILLAGISARSFTRARQKRGTPASWFVAGAYVMALSQIVLFSFADLGLILAAALVCAMPPGLSSLPMAAVCGLALDLSGILPLPLTPALCLSALAAAALPKKHLRFLLPALLSVPVMLLTRQFDPMIPISLGAGGILSLFLPVKIIPQPVQEIPGLDPGAAQRLEAVAEVLSRIQSLLLTENASTTLSDAALFDRAAEEVCQHCLHHCRCWEESTAETRRWLSAAAPVILEKGAAEAGDLPAAFTQRCRHLESFLQAVNRSLTAFRYRKQCRAQVAESRMALCGQCQFLGSYLAETARQLENPVYRAASRRYRPEFGIHSAGKYGAAASGDRSACFPGAGSLYYVLLCDGMGTGPGAAAESENAMALLTGLLQAGLSAAAALEMLNGLYVLRNSGGFSTADLLELHLDSGRAVLYKWGAAPSYIKHQGYARKVGTAAPPPGLGIGGSCRAEVIRLSLIRGETVVLVSDGVSGEETRQRIAGFADPSPEALANYIIAGAGQHGEDDMTAVAVRLRPPMSLTR